MVALALASALALSLPAAAPEEGCALLRPGAEASPATGCLHCHHSAAGAAHAAHPVDVDYAQAARRAPFAFRTPEQVVARGILLPEGMLRCATCHDARSPWKHKLALPPGSPVRAAVDLRDPRTLQAPAAPLPPGSDVGRKPLCLGCHAFD
jgi:hypothetical protein